MKLTEPFLKLPIEFSAEEVAKVEQLKALYPDPKSAIMPVLWMAQRKWGWLSVDVMRQVAQVMNLPYSHVYGVATFYTMYKRKPTGDWLVSVCTNTMCGVLGGDKAFEALRDYLGVDHDETTSDGKITLEHAECLAACDYAPVMTVNYEFFDQITEDSALTLVKQLQNGERPQPTRGTRLCTLKEMAVQLAGFADDRGDDVIADGPAGEPTLAGNRLAERFGITHATIQIEVEDLRRQGLRGASTDQARSRLTLV